MGVTATNKNANTTGRMIILRLIFITSIWLMLPAIPFCPRLRVLRTTNPPFSYAPTR
jgi:hypothetical protein